MALTATISREEAARKQVPSGVTVRAAGSVVPLSWEQEQIWLHGMLYPELPLYTETFAVLYRGELQVAALEASLGALCRRYEILRTSIREENGIPRQVVGAAVGIKVASYDFSGLAEGEREERLARLLDESARRPFDLAKGPLVRAFAVRVGERETRIYLTMHHLVFDGASLRQIVLPEMVALYEGFCAGTMAGLKAPALQYADYAVWQRARGKGASDRAMAFWRSKLADASPLHLPVDSARSAQSSRRGGVHRFELDEALAKSVMEAARRERTTAFSVLLSGFIVLLARCSDTQDVTLGTVYGGRSRTELEGMLGCFLNILLLRTELGGDPSFREILARVREVTLDAVEHAEAPFQEVVREAMPGSSTGDAPVQAVFSFQPPAAALPADWDLDVFGVFNGCAKFDLHLEVEQAAEGFRGRMMYNRELFEAETIDGMMQHWMNLIRAAVATPETCIWKLNLLGAKEQEWLLDGVNASEAEFPQACVHDLFAQRAAETPEALAICCDGRSVSYEELEGWSARVAGRLGELGFGVGSVVGVMVERSPEMLAGLLGIMRAGAAYVPLDPTYPAGRLEHMMKASGMGLLIVGKGMAAELADGHPPVLEIGEALSGEAEGSLAAVAMDASAYILFTSGSTGVPKGVEIPHRALTNLIWSMRERPGMTAEDVLLAVTSISFDIAALELYLPLIVGAKIELATAADATDPGVLAEKLRLSGATMMQATPATWRMLIDDGWTGARPMKMLCGGEALTGTLARQLLQRPGSVWNMYGPTETTIWSACAEVKEASRIVLGEPVANTQLHVLDSHQALLPAGVSGELYIGGAGLAIGYRGQAELTAERFPMVALRDGVSARLYRTGDRVKRLRDGSLVFLGRNDRQIKLHGFRIELGEIEQVLNGLPGVQQSIVVQTQHATRGEMLAAFVVPKAGVTVQVEELRTGMAKSLPKYMQPAVVQVLMDVPLTLNGKLDRSRLPGLLPQDTGGKESVQAEKPQGGVEKKIAGMWCELLDVKAVGRRENFFDLGGHSLLAARFCSMAGREFGRKLSFAGFVQAATIAQVAELVQGRSAPKTQVLKQGSGKTKQLIWIGAEPWLTRFARHLTDEVSLYAITPQVGRRAKDVAMSVEEMATQILGEVRAVQPEGPYLLGGFCLRSLLAYEIAQRLKADGQEVALLVLGDVYAPGQRPHWTVMERLIRRAHRESCNLMSTVRSGGANLLPKLKVLMASWVQRVTDRSGRPETRHELLKALYKAELRYTPVPFKGRVMFLESGESRLLRSTTSETWQGLIQDVEVFRYPGIHENVLEEPYLRIFADEVQQSIDRALAVQLTTLQL